MRVLSALAPHARPAPGHPDWEASEMERVTARLVAELAGRIEPARVRREVERAASELQDATVRRYVPLLVERRVRRTLRQAAPMLDHERSDRSTAKPEGRSAGPLPARPTPSAEEAS